MIKRTKIVATIGPKTESYENLKRLADEGVNVFRLNFSHGDHAWHGNVIKRIKRLNQKTNYNIPILLDTKGPEIRTGDLKNPITIKRGETITLTTNPEETDITKIKVSYDNFINDVEVGETILVDNGVMDLKVLKKEDKDIICKVMDGGQLTSRRHLNLPGKDVSLASITKKDWADIDFGIKMGIDFIALSFVRRGKDIEELKNYLEKQNAKIDIVSKVESFEASKNLEEIVEASDVIMVARGDLGAELPFEKVPQIQKKLIDLCALYKKPVIVATHMLESMIKHPVPTRAEVSDIYTAVKQRTDTVMLSGETAAGNFPFKSVKAMQRVIVETEKNMLPLWNFRNTRVTGLKSQFCKMTARTIDEFKEIEAIVVITRSGHMANLVSAFRPQTPILAFTNTPAVRRKMNILWGTTGYKIDFSNDPNKTIKRAKERFLTDKPNFKGKKFILLSDVIVDGEFAPTIQVREF